MYSVPPVQVAVPALVSPICKYIVLDPRFIVPVVAIVIGLPVSVPPNQLNWPAIVTGALRFIVPLVKLTVSLVAGTPAGVQLAGLNQWPAVPPLQFFVVW